MLKAGKTNTTRPFCLIFEIFRAGSRKSGACFVATLLWGMEDAWVQSYIYIGLKLAAPFPPSLPMPSSLLGSVRTRARTRQGRRGGLNGLRPGATDAHTRSTQRAGIMQCYALRKVCIFCEVCTNICILLC